jgi:hypothetical protein
VIGRDLINHTVTASITHLSEFAFFAAAPTGIDPTPEPGTYAWKIYLPAITHNAGVRDAMAPAAPPVLPEGSHPIYLPLIGRP